MISKTYPLGSFERYPYVVILSRMEGKFLLSRHKQRTTWEFQGGHIEQGETPLQAAKRELFEESGAAAFEIEQLCDYWRAVKTGRAAHAAWFLRQKFKNSARCLKVKWLKHGCLKVCPNR